MVDPVALPADFNRRIAGFRVGSGTFRMNVALSRACRSSSRCCRKRATT